MFPRAAQFTQAQLDGLLSRLRSLPLADFYFPVEFVVFPLSKFANAP
jgi:hypothetical protein